MAAPTPNSLDAVSDRDFAAEFLSVGALIGVHLSRLAEDLILFSGPGYRFFSLAEQYTTGSSLMPQKRNPDALELARGKSGRIIGALAGLLATLKGLPSGYNKDLQEDKEPLFDAADTLLALLPVVAGVVRTLRVHPDAMRAALDETMLATDLADYLVLGGLPFREAHEAVGRLVQRAEAAQCSLREVVMEELNAGSSTFDADVHEVFDFERSAARRRGIGGTAPDAVRRQIEAAKARLVES
jgi:argininosuccinate lyase